MTSAVHVHEDIRAAMRTKLLAVVKATTGALTSISATGNTFSRTSGSFLDDGFGPGDEIMVSGAGQSENNGRTMIRAVTALAMVVDKSLTTEAAGASITIAAGLWQGRSWQGNVFHPTVGAPYVAEQQLPGPSDVQSIGDGPIVRHFIEGAFILHYPADRGTVAPGKMAGAILRAFVPGTALIYGQSVGRVERAERRPGFDSPPWCTYPILVRASVESRE